MFNFSDINENQEETGSVTENSISDGKEMNKNDNEHSSETEYASVEDPETWTELQRMRPF